MTAEEKSGKKNEFIDAYLDYYSLVFSSIYTKLGSREDAEDICQEVFVRYYEKIESVTNTRRWLLSTAKNVLFNYYKKMKPDYVSDPEELDDVGFTFANGFRDTRIIIKETLDTITDDEIDLMIVDLIAVHNFTYSEVAKIIGLTRRQIEYRYSQLVKKIIDRLKFKGIESIEELL